MLLSILPAKLNVLSNKISRLPPQLERRIASAHRIGHEFVRDQFDNARSNIAIVRDPLRSPTAPRLRTIELICCFAALASLVASPVAGTVAAAVFLGSAAVLAFLRPTQSARDVWVFLPILALPLLAMISTLWSDAPERTLRAGLQMMLTMAASILICRRVSNDTLILMLFVALSGVCALALPSLPRVLADGQPLIGPYGSKNAMAYAAHLLVALALAITCTPRRSLLWRLAAGATIPIGLGLMYLAQSAGALLALVITLTTFPALLLVGRMNNIGRVVTIAGALITIALVLAVLPDLETAAADFRQNVLHKDATLTGRSYLWDFADRLAQERPLLGHGYYAFWRTGNIDAEGLWRYAGIASRTGFNFHSTFVEMRVDLGWVGMVVLVLTCVAITGLALVKQLTKPSVGVAFLLTLTISELIRATAETSLFGPFSYYSLLLMATAIYAVSPSLAAMQIPSREAKVGRRERFRIPHNV